MRSYHVTAVADAIGKPAKWVDNLLSHHTIDGVTSARRGVPRRVSGDAAVRIWVIATLSSELGLPIARAVEISGHAVKGATVVPLGHGLSLAVDIALLRASVERVLAEVAEHSVVVRRGRPPGKRDGAPD